ncbi:biorientation of chromosomes in cell division protein 1-like 1 isoform X3 [Erpetoichthys calabaricus]|uniref:biorientation of chromosomes in cell division protein 1-like 1 isoform X3 n=1 Tax=Erpetoichthys calabaricus TaxID=27687 RepID=UPI002234DBD1|nr:biorientation of chromosomes in cell division protein 1-like 1 isoform X3 [Erpetoichthys calabaricus]
MAGLPPGDPKLVSMIVNHLKSQGLFDQFRRDCLADVDTKPAYLNLRQRVDNFVSNHLSNHTWSPHLNKNQLRNNIRQLVLQSGMLEAGVDRIITQVVDPKIHRIFRPQVERVVHEYLASVNQKDESHFGSEQCEDLQPYITATPGLSSGPVTTVANDAMSILDTITSLNQEASAAWASTESPVCKTGDRMAKRSNSLQIGDGASEKDRPLEELAEKEKTSPEFVMSDEAYSQENENTDDTTIVLEEVINTAEDISNLTEPGKQLIEGNEDETSTPEKQEEGKIKVSEKQIPKVKEDEDVQQQEGEDSKTQNEKHHIKQKARERLKEEYSLEDSDLEGLSDISVSSVHTSDLSSFEEESEEEILFSDTTEEGEITSEDEGSQTNKTLCTTKEENPERKPRAGRQAYVHKPFLYSKYYSDSDDEVTVEQRRRSIAKDKEERLLKRQQYRERLEEKRKQKSVEKAKLLEIQRMEEQDIQPQSFKETRKEQKVLEKKVAINQRRKRDSRKEEEDDFSRRRKYDADEDSKETPKKTEENVTPCRDPKPFCSKAQLLKPLRRLSESILPTDESKHEHRRKRSGSNISSSSQADELAVDSVELKDLKKVVERVKVHAFALDLESGSEDLFRPRKSDKYLKKDSDVETDLGKKKDFKVSKEKSEKEKFLTDDKGKHKFKSEKVSKVVEGTNEYFTLENKDQEVVQKDISHLSRLPLDDKSDLKSRAKAEKKSILIKDVKAATSEDQSEEVLHREGTKKVKVVFPEHTKTEYRAKNSKPLVKGDGRSQVNTESGYICQTKSESILEEHSKMDFTSESWKKKNKMEKFIKKRSKSYSDDKHSERFKPRHDVKESKANERDGASPEYRSKGDHFSQDICKSKTYSVSDLERKSKSCELFTERKSASETETDITGKPSSSSSVQKDSSQRFKTEKSAFKIKYKLDSKSPSDFKTEKKLSVIESKGKGTKPSHKIDAFKERKDILKECKKGGGEKLIEFKLGSEESALDCQFNNTSVDVKFGMEDCGRKGHEVELIVSVDQSDKANSFKSSTEFLTVASLKETSDTISHDPDQSVIVDTDLRSSELVIPSKPDQLDNVSIKTPDGNCSVEPEIGTTYLASNLAALESERGLTVHSEVMMVTESNLIQEKKTGEDGILCIDLQETKSRLSKETDSILIAKDAAAECSSLSQIDKKDIEYTIKDVSLEMEFKKTLEVSSQVVNEQEDQQDTALHVMDSENSYRENESSYISESIDNTVIKEDTEEFSESSFEGADQKTKEAALTLLSMDTEIPAQNSVSQTYFCVPSQPVDLGGSHKESTILVSNDSSVSRFSEKQSDFSLKQDYNKTCLSPGCLTEQLYNTKSVSDENMSFKDPNVLLIEHKFKDTKVQEEELQIKEFTNEDNATEWIVDNDALGETKFAEVPVEIFKPSPQNQKDTESIKDTVIDTADGKKSPHRSGSPKLTKSLLKVECATESSNLQKKGALGHLEGSPLMPCTEKKEISTEEEKHFQNSETEQETNKQAEVNVLYSEASAEFNETPQPAETIQMQIIKHTDIQSLNMEQKDQEESSMHEKKSDVQTPEKRKRGRPKNVVTSDSNKALTGKNNEADTSGEQDEETANRTDNSSTAAQSLMTFSEPNVEVENATKQTSCQNSEAEDKKEKKQGRRGRTPKLQSASGFEECKYVNEKELEMVSATEASECIKTPRRGRPPKLKAQSVSKSPKADKEEKDSSVQKSESVGCIEEKKPARRGRPKKHPTPEKLIYESLKKENEVFFNETENNPKPGKIEQAQAISKGRPPKHSGFAKNQNKDSLPVDEKDIKEQKNDPAQNEDECEKGKEAKPRKGRPPKHPRTVFDEISKSTVVECEGRKLDHKSESEEEFEKPRRGRPPKNRSTPLKETSKLTKEEVDSVDRLGEMENLEKADKTLQNEQHSAVQIKEAGNQQNNEADQKEEHSKSQRQNENTNVEKVEIKKPGRRGRPPKSPISEETRGNMNKEQIVLQFSDAKTNKEENLVAEERSVKHGNIASSPSLPRESNKISGKRKRESESGDSEEEKSHVKEEGKKRRGRPPKYPREDRVSNLGIPIKVCDHITEEAKVKPDEDKEKSVEKKPARRGRPAKTSGDNAEKQESFKKEKKTETQESEDICKKLDHEHNLEEKNKEEKQKTSISTSQLDVEKQKPGKSAKDVRKLVSPESTPTRKRKLSASSSYSPASAQSRVQSSQSNKQWRKSETSPTMPRGRGALKLEETPAKKSKR